MKMIINRSKLSCKRNILLVVIFCLFINSCKNEVDEAFQKADQSDVPIKMLSLLERLPLGKKVQVYDLDKAENAFKGKKNEEKSGPSDLSSLSFGNLSTLLAFPKEAEDVLRKIFPEGRRGVIATVDIMEYENLVIYEPKVFPRNEIISLMKANKYQYVDTYEGSQFWTDNATVYKLQVILTDKRMIIGPQPDALKNYLIQIKKLTPSGEYYFKEKEVYKAIINYLKKDTYDFTLEHNPLDCGANWIGDIGSFKNGKVSMINYIIGRDKQSAKNCERIYKRVKGKCITKVKENILFFKCD